MDQWSWTNGPGPMDQWTWTTGPMEPDQWTNGAGPMDQLTNGAAPNGEGRVRQNQGVKGESGAKGQKGEEPSTQLSPGQVGWLSDGVSGITQNSNGLNSIRFNYDAALQGRTSAGAYEDCFPPWGGPNDSTLLTCGYNGLSVKHNSGSVAMNLTTDRRCELKNHLNLTYSDPEIQLNGSSDSDEPTILFGTSASASYESAIRARDQNSVRVR